MRLVDWTAGFTDGDEMVTVLAEVGQVRHDDGLHIVGAGHDLVADQTVSAVMDGWFRDPGGGRPRGSRRLGTY